MSIDPYMECPCGSGKKLKWCSPKAFGQIEKIVSLIESKQERNTFAALDRLEGEPENPRCLQMYLKTVRAHAMLNFDQGEEAVALLDQTAQDFPEYGYPKEAAGDFLMMTYNYPEALQSLRDALACYPPEAVDHQARTLFKIGSCENFQGRPLAAWSAWQRALKLQPALLPAKEAIDRFITQNQLLPNKARHGLALRSPDELAVFNEERRRKWDEALAKMGSFDVDDLVMVFEFLTSDDQYDVAAWYNLGVAYAWAGQSVKAIEAFDHYLKIETDFEAAADAWDLCEILRLGADAEEYSDNILHIASYSVSDPHAFLERLKPCRQVLVNSSPDGQHSLHWMDKDVEQTPGNTFLVGGPPRQLAQIMLTGEGVQLVASSSRNLAETRAKFDLVAGDTVTWRETSEAPGSIQGIDVEPLLIPSVPGQTPEAREAVVLDAVQRYFETDWIRRPMRSLSGLSPIDASQSEKFKPKVEGLVRFRERNFARYGVPYKFDRLRNKLGLETHTPPDEREASDFSAYSAAQLSALVPRDLADEELLAAYRGANAVDATTTAMGFAREMTTRDSLADKIDMAAVFRRLANERIEEGETAGLEELIAAADAYDQKHYGGKNAADFRSLRAKSALAGGDVEGALSSYRQIIDEQPDRVDLLAGVVEKLLSSGKYSQAKELAELGIERAQGSKFRDLREQLQEYLHAAKARSK